MDGGEELFRLECKAGVILSFSRWENHPRSLMTLLSHMLKSHSFRGGLPFERNMDLDFNMQLVYGILMIECHLENLHNGKVWILLALLWEGQTWMGIWLLWVLNIEYRMIMFWWNNFDRWWYPLVLGYD